MQGHTQIHYESETSLHGRQKIPLIRPVEGLRFELDFFFNSIFLNTVYLPIT